MRAHGLYGKGTVLMYVSSLCLMLFLCVLCNQATAAQDSAVKAEVLTNKPSVSAAIKEQEPIEKQKVDPRITKAKALYQEGKLIEARDTYNDILNNPGEYSIPKKALTQERDNLNIKLLFSRFEIPESELYTIQPGDSLSRIAQKFLNPVAFIKKSNGLNSDVIIAGHTLRVIKGTFSVYVDKSANTLELKLNDKHVKTYRVATGRNNCSPVGVFSIQTKLIKPTWYHAGAIVPPDSPENILGTRWMGFDLKGYGIHGTTIPESIGTQSTSGCVRMYNVEVEEIYDLLPLGTKVTIVD